MSDLEKPETNEDGLPKIKAFRVHNRGGFDIDCWLQWYAPPDFNDEKHTPGVPTSTTGNRLPTLQDVWVSCQKANVAQGSTMLLHINILAGDGRTAKPWCIFDENSRFFGDVTISGTTYDSSVGDLEFVLFDGLNPND